MLILAQKISKAKTMQNKQILSPLLILLMLIMYSCSNELFDEPTGSESFYNEQISLKGTPANGNGNKVVMDFDFSYTIDCSSETLSVNVNGWGQFMVFGQPKNPNVDLGVFHVVITYTNPAGETWIWRDVGIDHQYMEDGELFVSIVGRSTASGNIDRDEIVVGHVVLNLDTGETVFTAGRELGVLDDMACDMLN